MNPAVIADDEYEALSSEQRKASEIKNDFDSIMFQMDYEKVIKMKKTFDCIPVVDYQMFYSTDPKKLFKSE